MKQITATGNLYGEQITIKQVSKAAARKYFISGKEVYLQSSNMYPFGVWQQVCAINNKHEDYSNPSFDKFLNEYSYYNCDSERGRYIHFYIKIK